MGRSRKRQKKKQERDKRGKLHKTKWGNKRAIEKNRSGKIWASSGGKKLDRKPQDVNINRS